MLGRKREDIESTPDTSVETLIGQGTEIQGDVHFAGGLHIDGTIKGKIMADGDKSAVLSISETGKVEGDVRVSHVMLNGVVEGDVHASKKITLSPKARVNGNVYYRLIEMNSGAMVNGQLVYNGEGGSESVKPDSGASKPASAASSSSRQERGKSETVEIPATGASSA